MSELEIWQQLAEQGNTSAIELVLEHARATGDEGLRERALGWRAQADERVHVHEDGSTLIDIQAGDCWLAQQQRWVMIPGFRMAMHPVTNAQYERFIQATGYTGAGHGFGEFLAHWGKNGPPKRLLNHPVVHVSMLDAMAYCAWAQVRLPGEWMWEKAAAGAQGQLHPWGSAPATRELAHIRAQRTSEVGKYSHTRTAYGCQDMIGNISEWCFPAHGDDVLGPQVEDFLEDPGAYDEVLMGVRGSAYLREHSRLMTCQHRRALGAGRRNRWVGFRVATLTPNTSTVAENWGELRSVCHEPQVDAATKLKKLEHILMMWPAEEAPVHEAHEYVRHHLGAWRFVEESLPVPAVLEQWLGGRGHRVFEALHPTKKGARPAYALLRRCVAHLEALRLSERGVPLGHIEAARSQALYEDLLSRSAPLTQESVRDGSWRQHPVSLREWGQKVAAGLEREDVVEQVFLSDVRLSAGVFPALDIHFGSHVITMHAQHELAQASWQEWSPRGMLQWLAMLAELVSRHPALSITFPGLSQRAIQELSQLWGVYAQWSGVESSEEMSPG